MPIMMRNLKQNVEILVLVNQSAHSVSIAIVPTVIASVLMMTSSVAVMVISKSSASFPSDDI